MPHTLLTLLSRPRYDGKNPSVGSSFVWTVAGLLFQGATRFLYAVLIAKFLGQETLGGVNTGIALAMFVVLLWPNGAANAGTKFIATARAEQDPERARATASFVGAVALGSTAVLAPAAGLWGYLGGLLDGPTAAWTSALVVSYSAYNVVRGIRLGTGGHAQAAAWEAVSSLSALTLLVAVFAARWDPLLLAPLTLGYALYAAAGWPVASFAAVPAERRREILGFSFWTALSFLASGAVLQLSVVAAKTFDTASNAGFYAGAVQLATPASMLASAVFTTIGPRVAHALATGDHQRTRTEVDRAVRSMVLLFVPAFAVFALLSDVLLRLVYTPAFAAAHGVFLLLLLGVSFSVFTAGNARLWGGTPEDIRLMTATNVAGLVVGALVLLLAAPRWGMWGSAAAFTAGSAVSSLAPFLVIWHRERMSWTPVALRFLAATALVAALLWWRSVDGGWLVALASVCVFAGAWAVAGIPDALRLLGHGNLGVGSPGEGGAETAQQSPTR